MNQDVKCKVEYFRPESQGPFELFYGQGGHGGPYQQLDVAVERAKRFLAGRYLERTIYVLSYDRLSDPSKNAVAVVRKVG